MRTTEQSLVHKMTSNRKILNRKIAEFKEIQQKEMKLLEDKLSFLENKMELLRQEQASVHKGSLQILEKLNLLESKVADSEKATSKNGETYRNDILKAVNVIRETMSEAFSVVQKREDAASENIAAMNYSMQEISRSLMSLDEGTRIIIAKMLLQDMEA